MQELLGNEPKKCISLETMQTFSKFQQNKELCDAVIILDDNTEIPIHRVILSGCSEYFKSAFTTILHKKSITKLKIPGIQKDIMLLLIKYIYLRELKLTNENVFDVLITADYLGLLNALDICIEYLTSILTPTNCISIYLFASDHSLRQLIDNCWKYVMKNFVQISQDSLELMQLPLDEFKSIIIDDDLNVKSEETVWETVIKWINYDADKRKKHIVILINCIRLGLLETQFFMEKVKEHPYVRSCEDCRSTIIDTLKFLYDLERIMHEDGEILTPAMARPRIPHEILFAIGGWSGGSPTNIIESYDTRADRWIRIDEVDPAGPRAYHGTCVVNFNIYIIGGFDGMDYFNSCRCFNPITKVWTEISPMHSKRCYVSTTVLDNIIYAMGGYDGHHRQNTAEKYDYRTNQWTRIASMNMQRSDASACTLNKKIYITGGFNGQECMHSAEVYDPSTNQWTLIATMRSRRSGVSCISYHGYLYVIGGFNGISRMCSGEKYNPTTNQWSPIPDMYNPRSNFAIEIIDDMIFAIGGFNGVTTIYHVECYDDRTNEWYEATDMNIYRSALSACVVEDLPNINDYIHKHRDRLMEEKRQKIIAIENTRRNTINNSFFNIRPPTPPNLPQDLVTVANANLRQYNILQQLNEMQNAMNNNNNNDNNNNGIDEVDEDVMEVDDNGNRQ